MWVLLTFGGFGTTFVVVVNKMENVMTDNKKILVGKIVAPQGLRGEVRVQTYTANPMDLQELGIRNQELGIKGKFVRALPNSTIIIAKIDGVDDRTAAEGLRNIELFVNRDELPATDDDEYYVADLMGMTVIKKSSGLVLGTVSDYKNFGGGDILELDNGDMVLFDGADVDMENRTVYVL